MRFKLKIVNSLGDHSRDHTCTDLAHEQSHNRSSSCSKAVRHHITVSTVTLSASGSSCLPIIRIELSFNSCSHNQYLCPLSISQIVSWFRYTNHQCHLPVLLFTSVRRKGNTEEQVTQKFLQGLVPRSPYPTSWDITIVLIVT